MMSQNGESDVNGIMEKELYEGFFVPMDLQKQYFEGRPLKDHMESMKNLSMSTDDIIVCAYPKCGSHWVWEILNVLKTGTMNKLAKESSMLDLRLSEKIDELPSPRILNSHFPPHLLPRAIKEKRVKVVQVYRNPNDVVISEYHHFKKAMDRVGADIGKLDDYIKSFPEAPYPFYNFFQYLKEFDQFLRENPDIPVITLTYEDLTYNPEANVRKLAEFIGVDVTDEQIRHTIETSSFDNMKKAEHELKVGHVHEKQSGETDIFRKGKVGDWKNYFTVADSEMFDDAIARKLADTNIKFTFT